MKIILDRLKDSAIYSAMITSVVVFVTAGAWWHIPGRTVFLAWMLAFAVLTLAIYAALWTIERVLIRAWQIKNATKRGYVPRCVVRATARDGR